MTDIDWPEPDVEADADALKETGVEFQGFVSDMIDARKENSYRLYDGETGETKQHIEGRDEAFHMAFVNGWCVDGWRSDGE